MKNTYRFINNNELYLYSLKLPISLSLKSKVLLSTVQLFQSLEQ